MTKQQQQTLVFVVMLVGGGGYFYWTKLFGPILKTIQERKEELKKKNADLDEAKRKEDQLKKLKEEASKFEERLFLTYARLPIKEEMHKLIQLLNRAEKSSKVILTPITPQPEVDRGTYVEVPFKVIVEGTFDKIGAFMNFLHGRDRVLAVTDVQWFAVGGSSIEKSVRVEMMLSAFRSKGESPTWTKPFTGKDAYEPKARFTGGFRDPFIPLTPQQLVELQSQMNLDRLECTGVIRFGRVPTAQFQDSVSRAQFTLKNGRLFQTTSGGDKMIPAIRGEIKDRTVVLIQHGKGEERYRKSFPIPNR